MKNFIEKWKSKSLGREKQDSQKFWFEMFQAFWKIETPTDYLEFERSVEGIGFIDVYVPGTRVIIEQKSRGRNLDSKDRQSDGSFLTPYDQAKRYDDNLPLELKAKWIVTCNFDEIWIYDMNLMRPERHAQKMLVKDLPIFYHALDFLVDERQSKILSEEFVSSVAGSLIQNFRDIFLDSISDLTDSEILSLNQLCIRLVFCLYAEDTGIFPKRAFLNYLKLTREKNSIQKFKRDLSKLFLRLDTPEVSELMDDSLLEFPYVDGELFRNPSLEILDRLDGQFDLRRALDTLIDASENFNWSAISPTIFGSIFESIMNPETRRSGGVHFTSIENIHRVIDPLFLDNLNSEFDRGDLESLHEKIANLKFLDPACGSGNFLTETYISLRKLENRILDRVGGEIRVSIENFYGIEINDFAVQIAKLALWISEHQMNGEEHFLPLKRNANIMEGNSLEIDWKKIVPDANYIMGNPPYIGRRYRSQQQAKEISRFFDYKDVDYVACWFKKASLYMVDSEIETGFVSTNSVTQGEQVYPIWQNLFDEGISINFARSTFKWENESPNKKLMASVFCVIIGFARFDREIKLLDGSRVKNINGYLKNAPSVCVQNRSKPLCKVPPIRLGNMPNDGGNLIIEAEALESFVAKDPRSKKFIKKLIGAEEFVHNLPRYCLWLVDAEPHDINSIKTIYDRVNACKKYREAGAADRKKLAKTPWLFREQINPEHCIVIPKISTSRREYLPIGFLDSDTIATDLVLIIPDGSLALFGMLSSRAHMAWMKIVCGRLGNGYRYSAQVVYNNFPFPQPNKKISSTAQKILDARSNHPTSSLAELYDPTLMPIDLREAHEKNDLAVLDSYGFPHDITDDEIVARLFEMYQDLIQKI